MHSRSAKTLLAATATALLALPVAAQARQGADDPVSHVRHSATEVHHHHHAGQARGGADDGPGHR
jgi:Spy/CpxP family protein refolding chaperone